MPDAGSIERNAVTTLLLRKEKRNPMSRLNLLLVSLAGLLILSAGLSLAEDIDGKAEGIPDTIASPPALPKDFAFTFALPYGQGDEYPREPEEFDRMLG